ncbi:MAG: 2-oxo-4-hydroxy-4-carboxy-5-ureidoimidazoline decarboxylase [Candidatus Limnocylindrales bacterium]
MSAAPSSRSTAVDAAGLAPLFEAAPRFLARLVTSGPFADDEALFARARLIAHGMTEAEQLELLDAHPRLGAPPEEVSIASYHEQGYDRPERDRAGSSPEAAAEGARIGTELERLNRAYEARFGFRYCVFVNGRPRVALLPDLAAALDADRRSELRRGLDAVIDIARDRRAGRSTVGPESRP